MARQVTVQETPAINDSGVQARLQSFIDRIEHVEGQEADLRDDKKEIYKEAKGEGFDTKVIRKLISDRKKDKNTIAEFEAIVDLYREALGWPLGGAEIEDDRPDPSPDPLI